MLSSLFVLECFVEWKRPQNQFKMTGEFLIFLVDGLGILSSLYYAPPERRKVVLKTDRAIGNL